jgi:hypothetical protein
MASKRRLSPGSDVVTVSRRGRAIKEKQEEQRRITRRRWWARGAERREARKEARDRATGD